MGISRVFRITPITSRWYGERWSGPKEEAFAGEDSHRCCDAASSGVEKKKEGMIRRRKGENGKTLLVTPKGKGEGCRNRSFLAAEVR